MTLRRRRFAASTAVRAPTPVATLIAALTCGVVASCQTSTTPEPAPAAPAATPSPNGDEAPAAPPAGAPPPASGEVRIHLEGAWIPERAARLGMDAALAAERDAAFAAAPPADGLWWDEQLQREVWGLWTDLCVECHGGSRTLKKVMAMAPPGRGWTDTDALFFTRSRAPRSVFRVIAEGSKSGKPDVKDMPAWQHRLSNEQMWGLVHFIKSASRKKGGDLR